MFTALALFPFLPLSLAAPLLGHRAPLRRAVEVGGRSANGGYIVAIKPNTVDPNNRGRWLNNVLSTNNVTLDDATTQSLKLNWHQDVFNGLAGSFSTEAVNALRNQGEVTWIEEDIEVHTTALLQSNAPWGVARVSTGKTSFSGQNPNGFNRGFNFGYTFEEAPGLGTEAFILDSGCRTTHVDFGGRAKVVATFTKDEPVHDVGGHGTHVAGTLGGITAGVAKSATLNCVKVLGDDGVGHTSDIILGINFAVLQATASGKPSVISMSLTSPPNIFLDNTVSNAISQGIPVIVSAGNDAQDARNFSPGRVFEAITVGATTIDDTFASFSNFGPAVNILAPGENIVSASSLFDDDTDILSGASMAVPHVSGLSLVIMGKEGKLSPKDLSQRLQALSVSGIIKNVPAGTTDSFAFNGVNSQVLGP